MEQAALAPNWDEIEPLARELGVSDEALRKWRERGRVPGKWQVPIVVHGKGRLSVSDVAPEVSV